MLNTSTAYDQFLEYLAQKVTPADILAFQAPKEQQERMMNSLKRIKRIH